MASTKRKRSGIVTFPEAPTDEAELCAVLVTQDETGNVRSFVRTGPGRQAPHPDAVALLAQSAEISNL